MTSALRSRLFLFLLAPLSLLLAGCGGPDLVDRLSQPRWGLCGTIIIVLDLVAIIDVVGDEARSTTNKLLWALLVIFFPVGGVILYFLFGRE
jgi:hypothetical protein